MRGNRNVIVIIVVSVLVVAGMSFAANRMGLGKSGKTVWGGYKDNVLKASLDKKGNGSYPGGYSGCSASGGGCTGASGAPGSRGSCCGGSGASSSLSVEQAKASAIAYYSQKYGDKDVECQIQDYGCHMEARILKGGNVIKRLSISNGSINEII